MLFVALLWGTFFFAIVKGGRSERVAAIIILAGVQLSHLVILPRSMRYHGVEAGVLIVDIVTFFAMFVLGLTSRKFWPMWITGMQGVTLLAHLSSALPDVVPIAYAAAVQLWSWPMLVTLSVVTWLHMRENGRDRRMPGDRVIL